MPLETHAPNTVLLSPRDKSFIYDNIPAGEADIRPGMLVEPFNNSGVLAWRKSSAAAGQTSMFVALEQDIQNLPIDTPYAIDSEMPVASIPIGGRWWGLIASGQNIARGPLQSAGDGTVKAATATTATANVYHFHALESSGGTVNALTRIRIMRVA